jgi:hypothetical protein
MHMRVGKRPNTKPFTIVASHVHSSLPRCTGSAASSARGAMVTRARENVYLQAVASTKQAQVTAEVQRRLDQ